MADWDSASLLGLFNRRTQRPSVDPISDATKYAWLAEAQASVVADVAGRCPWVLYGAPAALTTADNKVWTFGTDASGYPVFPIGKTGIYPSLGAVPDSPWTEGRDYLSEGTQIRIPNDRTTAGPLYWRGAVLPQSMSASVQPALMPPPSRVLIVIEAARAFHAANRQYDSADEFQAEYDKTLVQWLLVWRRQFKSGGALVPLLTDLPGVRMSA